MAQKTDFTIVKKEHDKPVYVSRELIATEAKIEALALKKREELIDNSHNSYFQSLGFVTSLKAIPQKMSSGSLRCLGRNPPFG